MRVRAVCAAVALGIGLALAGSAPGSADPAPTADFHLMQLNIRHGLSSTAWAADAQRATSMADIADFQEASQAPDRAAMATMLTAQGWDYWYPSKGGVEDPITWNASLFSLVSTKSVEAIPGQKHITPARYVNTVVLKQISSGRLVAIVNTHTINKGAPDGGLKQNNRTARLQTCLQVLHDQILDAERITPYVVATGDLNTNYMRDRRIQAPGLPTSELGPIINFDMPIGPTWGGTTELDYVMSPKLDNSLSVVDSAIVPGFQSDHHGVRVGFDFDGAAPIPPAPPTGARFAPGVVANNPHGDRYARRTVLRLMQKAIDNAPLGSSIHIATSDIGDDAIYRAIGRAVARGVYVQIVDRDSSTNSDERALRKLLGTHTAQHSWFTGCTSSTCRSVSKRMSRTSLLVSQAGQTPALKINGDRDLDRTSARRSSSATSYTDRTDYNYGFHHFFALIS